MYAHVGLAGGDDRAIRRRGHTRPTGLGEIGIPFIGGAVSNAFYGLTGKWLRHLPVTPERVLDTLKT
jgi:CO/xanthine dehydrogenase Mo-binding subunit